MLHDLECQKKAYHGLTGKDYTQQYIYFVEPSLWRYKLRWQYSGKHLFR